MELYQEILKQQLSKEPIEIIFPNLDTHFLEQTMESICYHTLQKIQEILKNDDLNDSECFSKIEEIVFCLESVGISCGNRHDFG